LPRPDLDADPSDPFLLQHQLEDAYMLYRKCFQGNSLRINIVCEFYILFLIIKVLFFSVSGLAADAIKQQKCLWHFRPKMHQLEHMCLGSLRHAAFHFSSKSCQVFTKHTLWETTSCETLRLFDFCPVYGNCKYWANYLNEDFIGRIKKLGSFYLT